MAKHLARYLEAEERLWREVGVAPAEHRVRLQSGGDIRVQELGEGPPLVFIHGASISGTSWCQLVAKLDGIRCLLVDRPGCGLSDPIVDGPLKDLASVQAYADRLLEEILDALGLDETAVGATSYGGYFAFRGAAAIPERVTRLVEYSWLVGAPSESAPLSARIGTLPALQAVVTRAPMTRSMVKSALRQFGLGKAIDSGAFSDVMLDWAHALLRHTDTMANDTRSSPRLFTPIKGQNDDVLLTDHLLSRLTMPVLLLWGEDDPNGGAVVARSFAPRLPNAELQIIPNAEHAPWIDDPDLCADHTQRFILTP